MPLWHCCTVDEDLDATCFVSAGPLTSSQKASRSLGEMVQKEQPDGSVRMRPPSLTSRRFPASQERFEDGGLGKMGPSTPPRPQKATSSLLMSRQRPQLGATQGTDCAPGASVRSHSGPQTKVTQGGAGSNRPKSVPGRMLGGAAASQSGSTTAPSTLSASDSLSEEGGVGRSLAWLQGDMLDSAKERKWRQLQAAGPLQRPQAPLQSRAGTTESASSSVDTSTSTAKMVTLAWLQEQQGEDTKSTKMSPRSGRVPRRTNTPPSDTMTPTPGPSPAAANLTNTPPRSPVSTPSAPRGSYSRTRSSDRFAEPSQTCIILDWDDTLFPTTYVRGMNVNLFVPIADQALSAKAKNEFADCLGRCSDMAADFLRRAYGLGALVLVTLARPPWVSVACKNFMPKIGQLITDLSVRVVYAQDDTVPRPVSSSSSCTAPPAQSIDTDASKEADPRGSFSQWIDMKSQAIGQELRRFYSQYQGQSWKNVISIGDSDFERLGTQSAIRGYLRETGIEVRTKTFKLIVEPSIETLLVELGMLSAWLPLMVGLDGGFDLVLRNLRDRRALEHIERTLQVYQPTPTFSSKV